MPTNRESRRRSRRSFIATAGTALSAPMAVAVAAVPLAPAVDLDDPGTRLERLEAIEAIRRLNEKYARHINAGELPEVCALFADPGAMIVDPVVRGLAVDRHGEDDAIEVAADGQSATARLARIVETEDTIGPSCPLVEMAREQGGGVVRRSERVLFDNAYVKHDGAWKIQRAVFKAAEAE